MVTGHSHAYPSPKYVKFCSKYSRFRMVAEAVSDPSANLRSVSSRPAMATESGRTPSQSHRPGVASESASGGSSGTAASNLGARLASAADISDSPPTKTRIAFNVTANEADIKSGFME